MEPSKYSYDRIVGLDVARGLAIMMMVLSNLVHEFSRNNILAFMSGPAGMQGQTIFAWVIVGFIMIFIAGTGVGIFLILFGAGMTLRIRRRGYRLASGVIVPLLKQYGMLIAGGLLFTIVWNAEILHFIGLFGILGIWLTVVRKRWLVLLTLGTLVCSELLRLVYDTGVGWVIAARGPEYADMWSPAGCLRQFFFNGYHSFLPWFAFVTYGLLLGRLDLTERRVQNRMIILGVVGMCIGLVLRVRGVPARFLPADTLFVLLAIAKATWVIGLSLRVGAGRSLKRLLGWIANMGRLSLSHYLAHVFLGIMPVMAITGGRADLSFDTSFLISMGYVVLAIMLGNLWLRFHLYGPLEWFIRRVGRTRIIQQRPS